MGFKLLKEAVLTEAGGIDHIEDLPVQEFIRTVETLKDKIVTEKIDGYELAIGLDDTGFYTTRELKSPKRGRFYNVDDYPVNANSNAFRAAHLAFEKVEHTIKKCLTVGDALEVEVLFGRQPNTVTYGHDNKNFIVILRGINGTPNERVQKLANALNGKVVSVESSVVSSSNGDDLNIRDEKLKWEFTKVTPIPTEHVNLKNAMILLKKLKTFLSEKNKAIPDKTNLDIADASLTNTPKSDRAAVKAEREKLNAHILTAYKAPIKELLLTDFVRKLKPMLQDKNVKPHEDIGIEGVVVRDPVTGSQTKIVDKDVFTAINTFNSTVRGSISGLVRTTDAEAPSELRGGVFGQAKIKIADLLGARELALSAATRKYFTKFKGDTVETTAANTAKHLNISDLSDYREKIVSILENALKDVKHLLHSFKKEAGKFTLTLKTGKQIGISSEVMKRTLTAFAETKSEIIEVVNKVKDSKTPTDLLMALYGKTIESLFSGGSMSESQSLIKMIVEFGSGGAASSDGEAASMANPSKYLKEPSAKDPDAEPFKQLRGNKLVTRRIRNFKHPLRFPVKAHADQEPKYLRKKHIGETADGGATSAGAVAAYPQKLNASPVVRTKIDKKKKGTYQLISLVNEDFAHLSDMKFATDVSSPAGNDVELKTKNINLDALKSDTRIDGDVTPMNVSRYLDKAHEVNDAVDTVPFGLETDTGAIVKVYVNATQADQFEKIAAQFLGQEEDLEQVVNELARKFDIVDVEWPPEIVNEPNNVDQDPTDIGAEPAPENDTGLNTELEPEYAEDDSTATTDATAETPNSGSEQETGGELEPENAEGEEEEEDEDTPADVNTPADGEEEEEDVPSDDTSDDEEEEEDGDEEPERDDFGQIIGTKKKKKKKKKVDADSGTEPTPEKEDTDEKTEEGVRFKLLGSLISE